MWWKDYVLVLLLVTNSVSGTVLVCYLQNSSFDLEGEGKFSVSDIDPTLCTHYIYAFAKITKGRLDVTKPFDLKMYAQVNALKKKNPKMKTLLAVGGWSVGSKPFVAVSNSAAARKKFCATSKEFLQQHDFDGLDFYWQYPTERGGTAADKANFAHLVEECRRVFGAKLLITAATAAGGDRIRAAYDVPALAKHLDFFNVMLFHFRGGWNGHTGHNAPLGTFKEEPSFMRYMTVKIYAGQWLARGAPAAKLVIGLPTFGRSFTLKTSRKGIWAPATYGKEGPFTKARGQLAYYEVCRMIKEGATVTRYAKQGDLVVAIKGDQWVGYDDVRTMKTKGEWIKKVGFAGAMVWALPEDDFGGRFCGQGKFPLVRAIGSTLGMNVQSVNQGEPLTGCPEFDGNNATNAADMCNSGVLCKSLPVGTLLKHPSDCTKFLECEANGVMEVPCFAGLRFDPQSKKCDLKENVKCQ